MSSLYQSMIAVIEQSITPLAGRLGQQKYVIAIRDGFTAALPFMIIGSFMLVFIFPPFSPDTTNFHSVSVRSGHFHRADHRHLLHPRLRVAEAKQHYDSSAERGPHRRRPFV